MLNLSKLYNERPLHWVAIAKRRGIKRCHAAFDAMRLDLGTPRIKTSKMIAK